MKKSLGSIFLVVVLLMIVLSGCAPASAPVPPTPTLTLKPIPTTPTSLTSTSTPTPFPPFRDDFSQVLGDGWEWIKESKDGWNLHEYPGFLRVEVALGAEQILLRHAPEGNFEITTRVLFTPYSNFQSAGLIIYQDEGHFLSFHRGMCDYIDIIPDKCQGNAIYFNHIDHDLGVPEGSYSIGPQYPTPTENKSEAYLRLTREGGTFTAYYSDGGDWTIVGTHEADLFPYFVGIQTFGAQENNAYADFDYFTLEAISSSTKPPTPLPAPTIEPPSTATEFLTDVKVLSYDPLNSMNNWNWDSQVGNLANGIFELKGRYFWGSSLSPKMQLADGDGIILKFKLQNANGESEFVFDTGEWQTDSFRQFGIYNSNPPKADLFQGKNGLGGNYLHGNLSLKPDTWYNILMAIGKNGEFLAVMWEPADETQRAVYNETIGEKWSDKPWFFIVKENEGETLYVDDFYRISFGEIR